MGVRIKFMYAAGVELPLAVSASVVTVRAAFPILAPSPDPFPEVVFTGVVTVPKELPIVAEPAVTFEFEFDVAAAVLPVKFHRALPVAGITFMVAVAVQLLPSVPVTVYTVAEAGVAVTDALVTEGLRFVVGFQEYVVAPDAVNV